jgi:signal transduction histidine kinase
MLKRNNASVSFARRTWTELVYLVLMVPLALLGFAYVLGTLGLGVALAITFVGLPFLAVTGLGARRIGGVHRGLARSLLRQQVTAPPPFQYSGGFFGWMQAALRDGPSWRARAYLVVRLPLAFVGAYVVWVFWIQGAAWLTYPLWRQPSGRGRVPDDIVLDIAAMIFRGGARPNRQLDHRLTVHFRQTYMDSWPRILLVMLLGVIALLIAPWATRGLLWIDRWLIRTLLGRSANAQRMHELRMARAQAIDESAATLRRIERDLHDGTQAQLATLAMTLGQAKEKLEHRDDVPFDPDGALGLVDSAHRHAKEALLELRDIARGIHPPALDVGLDAALATLVARSAVATELNSDIRHRPNKAIETIAYFTVAELLANVAKHSGAQRADVRVATTDTLLSLTVRDNGVGGAKPGGGSGLLGLADRVRTVDGRLDISSPPGGPTLVTVELPLVT